MVHDLSDICDFLSNNPRELWKNGISSMILKEDKENHKCSIVFSKQDPSDILEIDLSLDSLEPNFKIPFEEGDFIQDSNGTQYFIPYLPVLDCRRANDFRCNYIVEGDLTELVSLNKGEGPFIAPLGFDMVYISPNSTEYNKISEDDLEPEFREQLHRWWAGEFEI